MERYVIAVDQSTSASKAFLLNDQGEIVKRFSAAHEQYYPKPGYVEHDGEEIWQNVRRGVIAMAEGLQPGQIAGLAISNQRETTVLWDAETGKPVCHAVVWQDVRGGALCETLREHAHAVRLKTGLQLSPYYSAAKAAAVLQSRPDLMERAQKGELRIGTVDSYLVYRLTNGQRFQTDVSNASRTQLMALKTLTWDDDLLAIFGIPKGCLPKITLSDGDFGCVCGEGLPQGILITGVMGDSHAALFGQGCWRTGMAKATFGTGSSVMMNVGEKPTLSQNGLSASVGYGFQGKTCYVLEGNVTCSGDTLCWLRDQAGLVESIEAVEPLAASVESAEGVYLIPAFSGLGAPYFDDNARAILYGMNRGTTKAHIVRAALESMAYQDADVIAAMEKDTGIPLAELRADGGPTHNGLLMQLLADLLGCPVRCAAQSELSALGVGYMAGVATGLYPTAEAIPAMKREGRRYQPGYNDTQRQTAMNGWRQAVARCR